MTSSTRSTTTRQRLLMSAAPAAILVLAACAGTPPPTAQLAVSTAAVANATAAGSTELAPVEMTTARQKLDRANLAMAAKDYPLALALALQSQLDAPLTEAKARSTQAGKAAAELQEASRALREEIARKTQ